MLCSLNNPSPTQANINALEKEIRELEKAPNNEKQVGAIKGLKTLCASLVDRLEKDNNLLRWKRENEGGYSVRNAIRHALPNKR